MNDTPRQIPAYLATAKPELWRGNYWSSARFPSSLVTADIIANRDAFARRHGLTKQSYARMDWPRVDPLSDFDHAELYLATGGRLALVCSNYGCPPPAWLGMLPTPPLYVVVALSFYRVFESLKVYHASMKQAR